LRFADILEAMDGVTEATSGKTIEDYGASWLLRHGVQRGIEIFSEASRALPPEVTALEPAVPWTRIWAIGNVLRHEYHRLSDQLIWGIVADRPL
jgi:uncharacterized protein with HEPN domain